MTSALPQLVPRKYGLGKYGNNTYDHWRDYGDLWVPIPVDPPVDIWVPVPDVPVVPPPVIAERWVPIVEPPPVPWS
jgi:hypothetical protein